MNEDAIDKLQEIFRIIFELAPETNVTQARQMDTHKWDSMATVLLASAIESEFDINLDVVDAMRMTSYKATLLLLEEKFQ